MESIECGMGVTLTPKVTTFMGLDYNDYEINNLERNGSTITN